MTAGVIDFDRIRSHPGDCSVIGNEHRDPLRLQLPKIMAYGPLERDRSGGMREYVTVVVTSVYHHSAQSRLRRGG